MVFFEIFPWDKNFETGIELIDKQHKQLVDILNKLAAHLANNSNDIVLNEIFDELASYADYHFKDEEKIWDEHFGDDEWNTEHHKTHGSFIGEVLKIKENKENKSLDVVVHDIVSYLSKWLAYHILDTDKRLSIAVREIKSGTKIEEAKIVATQEMNGSLKVIVDTVLSMYETLSSRTLNLMREKSLRRKAEEALKITEERLKLVIEDDSEDIWDWDLQDNILSKSLTKESINYIANNYLNETKNNSTIHPTDIQQVKDDLQNHINGKTEFYTNKHRLLHPDGSWSWILSRGKVVKRNSDGKALRMIGTNTDITERES